MSIYHPSVFCNYKCFRTVYMRENTATNAYYVQPQQTWVIFFKELFEETKVVHQLLQASKIKAPGHSSITIINWEIGAGLPSSSLSLSRNRASMRNLSSVPNRDCNFKS